MQFLVDESAVMLYRVRHVFLATYFTAARGREGAREGERLWVRRGKTKGREKEGMD